MTTLLGNVQHPCQEVKHDMLRQLAGAAGMRAKTKGKEGKRKTTGIFKRFDSGRRVYLYKTPQQPCLP